MVEGSIIGYESNVKSGGVGARYFGDRCRHAIPA
ncbi:CsgG/HfaB family protein [Escherichia coli]